MKMEISVSEAMELINEIRQQPEGLFEMIRTNVQETVGQYLSGLMETELTGFLGRERYERVEGEGNHRNGSYCLSCLIGRKSPPALRFTV